MQAVPSFGGILDVGAEGLFVVVPTDRDSSPYGSSRWGISGGCDEVDQWLWIPLYRILETGSFELFLVKHSTPETCRAAKLIFPIANEFSISTRSAF
jgi:hypothetical protein